MDNRWKPENGQSYWVINITPNRISKCTWQDDYSDNVLYDSGNCFKLKDEARDALELVERVIINWHSPGLQLLKDGEPRKLYEE